MKRIPEPVALGFESTVTALLAKCGFLVKGTTSTSPIRRKVRLRRRLMW